MAAWTVRICGWRSTVRSPGPGARRSRLDEQRGHRHFQPGLAALVPGRPGAAEHVGDGGGRRRPGPGHLGGRFVLAVEGVTVIPDDEQRPAVGAVDLEGAEAGAVARGDAGY